MAWCGPHRHWSRRGPLRLGEWADTDGSTGEELTTEPNTRTAPTTEEGTVIMILGTEEHAPTRALRQALHQQDPELMEDPGEWDRATVGVVPRCTQGHSGPYRCPCDQPAHAGAWYDVYYTRPAPTEIDNGQAEEFAEYALGGRLGQLAAPGLRPWAERLAEQGPATLQGWSPEQIQVMGGQDKALELVRDRQRQQAAHLSADSYDWTGAARTYLPVLRAAHAQRPLLPVEYLADAARARLWRARANLEGARESLRAREQARPVRPDRLARSRVRLATAKREWEAAQQVASEHPALAGQQDTTSDDH